MSGWVDKWGQPMADYEVRAIENPDWFLVEDAIGYLRFDLQRRGLAGFEAAACDTCGALFTPVMRHLRAHRRLCGWDNGSPAWSDL